MPHRGVTRNRVPSSSRFLRAKDMRTGVRRAVRSITRVAKTARETPRIAAVDNRGDMNELQVYVVETASMARASFRINRVSSKPAMRSAAYNI